MVNQSYDFSLCFDTLFEVWAGFLCQASLWYNQSFRCVCVEGGQRVLTRGADKCRVPEWSSAKLRKVAITEHILYSSKVSAINPVGFGEISCSDKPTVGLDAYKQLPGWSSNYVELASSLHRVETRYSRLFHEIYIMFWRDTPWGEWTHSSKDGGELMNVVKTIINHSQFHHVYRWYVYYSQSWVVYGIVLTFFVSFFIWSSGNLPSEF